MMNSTILTTISVFSSHKACTNLEGVEHEPYFHDVFDVGRVEKSGQQHII